MLRIAIVACWLGVLAGCGEQKYVPVSGQVTMNGQPLKGVEVRFQPIGSLENKNPGRGSWDTTNPEGKFTLRVDAKLSGAVPGKHRVVIATPPTPASERTGPFKEPIPARYNNPTTLTFDVPSKGTDAADFALTSP